MTQQLRLAAGKDSPLKLSWFILKKVGLVSSTVLWLSALYYLFDEGREGEVVSIAKLFLWIGLFLVALLQMFSFLRQHRRVERLRYQGEVSFFKAGDTWRIGLPSSDAPEAVRRSIAQAALEKLPASGATSAIIRLLTDGQESYAVELAHACNLEDCTNLRAHMVRRREHAS